MKCSVHHNILKLLTGTSCVSPAVVCFRCHVGSPLSVGADFTHFSAEFSLLSVSFRIEIDTHAVRPGLPHFKACGSPCNQNFSCYTSQFHSYTAVLSLDPNTEPGPKEGGLNGERGANAFERRTAKCLCDSTASGTHCSLFPPHNPHHFHTRIPRQQRSRRVPAQPLRGAAHLKGLEPRDGDLENFCRAFSWRYHAGILQCP